jgi:hypothetical protein
VRIWIEAKKRGLFDGLIGVFAGTNIAVDNIAMKLREIGVNVLRFGEKRKVVKELHDITSSCILEKLNTEEHDGKMSSKVCLNSIASFSGFIL